MKTVFLRVLEADDKAAALLDAVREPERARSRQRFEVDAASFASVPRSPFAYWAPRRCLEIFARLEPFSHRPRLVVSTNPLNADFRYARVWWEPTAVKLGHEWRPWAKGGAYSPHYYDVNAVIAWSDARSSYTGFLGTENRPLERPASVQHFFRPGLTWPSRTQSGLGMRAMPAGCVFGDKGPAALIEGDPPTDLLALLAVTTSSAFRYLVGFQMAFGSYVVGVIQRTPVPSLTDVERDALARLARRAWSLKRSLDARNETSHAFVLPALLQVAGTDVAARAAAWSDHVRTVEAELAAIQAELDDRCFVLYGIDEADRRTITEGFGTRGSEEATSDGANDAEDDGGENTDENESTTNAPGLAAELVSWGVGVAFGRFDMRLATGARPMPTEPEPFDHLPACSPGMLTGGNGLPLARPPAGYPLAFTEAGVLVDDLGHSQDLSTAVRTMFDAVFGADADRWWNDVAALLDPKGHDLRVWLAGNFFEQHVKRHSKSHRKAPIVWQLGTPSGRYSVWLYAHRLTRDSFFQLQNEVVRPKLTHEERHLTSLMQNAGGSPSAPQRKEIAAQEAVVEELRAMLDEVKRVAPLWNPNLDDGVVLTMAPLWRLVPQHKPWQKELKAQWDELAAGKYDWAHLAMHLWPERVVSRCATDRSLAIAHGLEDVFWHDDAGGKWRAREVDQSVVDSLIRERSSAAVKDALKTLVAAATPSGTKHQGSRTRRRSPSRKSERERTGSPQKRNGQLEIPSPELLSRVKDAIASNGDGASKAEVIEATGITESQWHAAINALLAQSAVAGSGERRRTRYHVVGAGKS